MRSLRRALCPVVLLLLAGLALAAPAAALAATAVAARPPALVGVVEALPESGLVGDWTVAGVVVHVAASTRVDQSRGAVRLGATVRIEGTRAADGSVNATEVEVTSSGRFEVHITGGVESLPAEGLIGEWVVAGRTVIVNSETEIDQRARDIALGVEVKVVGVEWEGGVLALSIRSLPEEDDDGGEPVDASFLVLRLLPQEGAPARADGVLVARSFAFEDGTAREDVKIHVTRLLPGTVYDVVIDDVPAGTIATNARGMGHLFLSSAPIPGSEPLPEELQPIMEREWVEVRDGETAVLAAELANARRQRGHEPVDGLSIAVLAGADRAYGMAIATSRGEEQNLAVRAHALPPSTEVEVVVDGFELAVATTDRHGRLRLEYSSQPDEAGELVLPEELRPVSDLIAIEILLAEDDTVIAAGTFAPVAAVTPTPGAPADAVRRRAGRK